jgi:GntR family transcriptional regulator, transcriptional repressor for pyruvate dehydrogenase complex
MVIHLAMFTPVRPARASHDIVTQIKNQIFEGRILSGNRLPSEFELCQQFRVSRTTVRDALRILESQGLVDIKVGAGGGAFVAEPRHETVSESLSNMLKMQTMSIEELAEARLVVETSIVALAAKRATAKDMAAMQGAIKQAREGQASGDPRFTPHSVSFHVALAEAAKNQVLFFTVNSFRSLFYDTIDKLLPDPDMQARAIQDHQKILDAIQARDSELAQQIMRNHLTYFKTRAARLNAPARPQSQSNPIVAHALDAPSSRMGKDNHPSRVKGATRGNANSSR